ncbi:MAG: zf-TFIIB domain-containing protein [Dehalococcoidales bacterium]
MNCPVCKLSMIDVEHDKIELDYCVKCKGVWFDTNELELLMEKYGLQDFDLSFLSLINKIDKKIREKKYRCPICRRSMGKVKVGPDSTLVIDICPRGDGLWFDGGEVAQLIKHTSQKQRQGFGEGQQVIDFLGEVFRI